MFFNEVGYEFDVRGAGEEAGFESLDAVRLCEEIQLVAEEIYRERLKASDAAGVLDDDGGDDAEAFDAVSIEDTEIGLYACTARAVGTSDGEGNGERDGRGGGHGEVLRIFFFRRGGIERIVRIYLKPDEMVETPRVV